jgi:uracil-DNA glycosylase
LSAGRRVATREVRLLAHDPHGASSGLLVELAEVVAQTRATLEDAMGRGVREEQAAGSAPHEAPAPTAAPRPEWFTIAEEARAAATADVAVDEGVPKEVRLARVQEDLGDCKRCGLCRERKSIVFGVGSAQAELVVIGEAPGQQEDEVGEPFVGPAGQMLDKMLENVLGLRRDQTYILNVVKCRPPKNRNPEPDELQACRPFLDAQLRAIAPKVILLLGAVAYRTVFRTDAGIMRNRGRWHEYGGVPVMPTFHPAYLLRSPQDKRLTFDDLKQLRDRYDRLGGVR